MYDTGAVHSPITQILQESTAVIWSPKVSPQCFPLGPYVSDSVWQGNAHLLHHLEPDHFEEVRQHTHSLNASGRWGRWQGARPNALVFTVGKKAQSHEATQSFKSLFLPLKHEQVLSTHSCSPTFLNLLFSPLPWSYLLDNVHTHRSYASLTSPKSKVQYGRPTSHFWNNCSTLLSHSHLQKHNLVLDLHKAIWEWTAGFKVQL